jgi:hypothetical protein
MTEHTLTEEKLLAMLAASRRDRESAGTVDPDVCGGLTFERAYALSCGPSLMTEEERQLIAASPRAARLIEHFNQMECARAANRTPPLNGPAFPSAPAGEDALPADRRTEKT